MTELELHDHRHLEAAQGWFELGNYLEANRELEKIAVSNHTHPGVLEMRCLIYVKAKKWDAALESEPVKTMINGSAKR